MDTSNNVRDVNDDVRLGKRTRSGGVRDSSDLKHYPSLGGNEGAVGNTSKDSHPTRRLSNLASVKESLLATPSLKMGDTEGSPTSS